MSEPHDGAPSSYKHPNNPIARNVKVFRVSWAGFKFGVKTDPGVRQWLIICLFFTPLGIWLAASPVELALLLASLWAILVVEFINTAIEAAVDRISLESHELSKAAKDIGSAAVFLTVLIALFIWALFLFT